jgi:signal transduction histidine kinase
VLTRDVTDQLKAEASLAEANVELHRLSQQLIVAQETERRHLARELHDDVQQTLVALTLSMEAAGSRPEKPPVRMVDNWKRAVKETVEHLRELTLGLHPSGLDDRGLLAALSAHVDRIRTTSGKGIRLEVDAELGRLAPDVETACFRIVQEALTNAVRHSGAAHVKVAVRRVNDTLAVAISDDGTGFDVVAARERAARHGSIGLLSMRERASLAGGRLEVESSPDGGTVVRVFLPIHGGGVDAESDETL